MEPHKCEGWEWHAWGSSTIPGPRFVPLEALLTDTKFSLV